MPDSKGNVSRDYAKFDRMRTEALREILRQDASLPSSESIGTDAILYILEVITSREKENPTIPYPDVDAAWATFQKDYWPSGESDGKSLYDFEDFDEDTPFHTSNAAAVKKRRPVTKRLIRIGFVAAVVVALLAATTIVAGAFGYNLWGWMANWSSEEFHFDSSEGSAPSTAAIAEPDAAEPAGIASALNSLGIDEPLYPTWIPERFILSDTLLAMDDPIFLWEAYSGEEDFLSITVSSISSNGSSIVYQKDNEEVVEYIRNDIVHYIFSNLGQYTATWRTQQFEVSIVGDISFDEIEKIIDSIYEV